MTSKTLVAAYSFPPYNDTSAVVAAKRVREMGAKVDVIANAMDSIRRRDPSLTLISGDLVDRYAALTTPTAFSSWPSIVAFAERGYHTVLDWEAEQGPYERIYSRAHFVASHFLAVRVKIARPGIHWTAEFSDPLSHDVLGQPRISPLTPNRLTRMIAKTLQSRGFRVPEGENVNEWSEVMAFALADELLFTNTNQRDFMIEHVSDPKLAEHAASIARVAPHPTLPREFYSMVASGYELEPDVVNIGYFGNFYANRSVDQILDAMALMPREDVERLRLHVFTAAASADKLAELVVTKGLEGIVLVRNYVHFLEFLDLADQMDLLLVSDAVTPEGGGVNPFLPSKWSDYKGSTTPVWALVEEGSPLDTRDDIAITTPVGHFSAYLTELTRIARHGVPGIRTDEERA